MAFTKEYSKNEILFTEGSECRYVGLLNEGKITISSVSYKGTELLYKIISKGDYFGNNLLFSDYPFYRGNVTATEDSKVTYYTKEEFLNALRKDDSLLEEYLMLSSKNTKLLNQTIKILSLPTAEEKILYLLSIHNNIISYESISGLSKTLFISREAASRSIHKLIQDKIITMDKKTIKRI